MKLVVDLGPIHGNDYTLEAAFSALVYGPITNTNMVYYYCHGILLTYYRTSAINTYVIKTVNE